MRRHKLISPNTHPLFSCGESSTLGFGNSLSQEEINAEKRRAEDELKKSRIIILPDEIAPNANLRKVDIEAV